MPNFTLYINSEQFALEPNKSGLVNQLLRSHYGSSNSATTCKLGHALASGRDKCMTPKCKYSVYA